MNKNITYVGAAGLGFLTGLGLLYGSRCAPSCKTSASSLQHDSSDRSELRDESDLGDLVGQHRTYAFQVSARDGVVHLGNVTGIPGKDEEPTAISWNTQTKVFAYDNATSTLWNVVLEMGSGSRHDPAVAVLEKRSASETTYQAVAVRAENVDEQRFAIRAHPLSQQQGVWSAELFPGVALNYRSPSTDVSVAERRMDAPRRSYHIIPLPALGFTFDFESLGGLPEQFTVIRQRDGSFALGYLQEGREFLTATGTGAREDPAYLVLERRFEDPSHRHDYIVVGLREVRGSRSSGSSGPHHYEAVVAVQKPEFEEDQGFQARLFKPDSVELFFGNLTVFASR